MKPTTSPESEDDVWNEEIDGAVLQRLAVSGTGTAARRIGLTGINAVFRLQTVPKNDFCRLFVKAGVLDALAVCLRAVRARHCAPGHPAPSCRAGRLRASLALSLTAARRPPCLASTGQPHDRNCVRSVAAAAWVRCR